MARKSAAALSIIAVLPGQRYEPPTSLTKPQAVVWRAIASTKSADWFTKDSHPMLAQLCRHVVLSDELAKQIDAMSIPVGDKDALNEYATLLRLQQTQSTMIVKLGTAMRLTQQSRATKDQAKTVTENAADASSGRPWAQSA